MGKQGADLCSSSLSQLFVTTYFGERRWQDYLDELRELDIVRAVASVMRVEGTS